MVKKMLIDATHEEETRVAVVQDNRLVDFDYESKVRKQLKGSIFLAKVTRVEPSLQAAFVNFGGNRHGFLPFSEIHPDYYRIPIEDREALLAEQEREMDERLKREEEEDADEDVEILDDEDLDDDVMDLDDDSEGDEEPDEDDSAAEAPKKRGRSRKKKKEESENDDESSSAEEEHLHEDGDVNGNLKVEDDDSADGNSVDDSQDKKRGRSRGGRGRGGRNNRGRGRGRHRMAASSRRVETVGGDGIDGDQLVRPSARKNYKIQEVVKRGQIMLIQVSKEERGNKGAAVSTYLSLPGRYCVLMPNSPRAGGVSRKIANYKERKRMREILNELKVPQGMSVIMRTAGTSRTKTEIKRDLDYLMKLWDNIRELTLSSTAPALVHEEGNLIRRSIRDIYAPDIEEVLVAGADGYKFGKDFMKMMIPSHAKRVKEYKDDHIPLFHRYQVENQISEMGTPNVTLPSGGYLVINPTEALVSVDVNSGRATKERHIEETALRTNLESADEVARQLRLRDLGGLVVIDFIDMEDRRNNRKVENRLKEALSGDRARIQIGRISSFGLLELSRQRLNPSLNEAQQERCPHCQGTGHVKTIDATAIMVLRSLEQEGIKKRAGRVQLKTTTTVALYILNNKRDMLADIESKYGFTVLIETDDTISPSHFEIEPLDKVAQGQNEATEDDSGEQDSSQEKNNSGRRRRGRRGGRRRNNSRSQEQNQEDRQEADVNSDDSSKQETDTDSSSKAADESSETVNAADEKPKKASTKKRSGKKKKESAVKENSADDAAHSSEENTVDEKEASVKKSTKKAAKKSAKKRASRKKSEKPSDKEDVKSESLPQSSNDDAPAAEDKDYETVNQAPEKKKKGWWNRLTD